MDEADQTRARADDPVLLEVVREEEPERLDVPFVDLDAPGRAIDAGWAGADARIAARSRGSLRER